MQFPQAETALRTLAVDYAWPIGSVFISVVNTDPAELLGFGVWQSIGAGRVLVGWDANDTDFDVLEETGGVKTSASSGVVSQPTFTGVALAGHAHTAGTLAASAHAGTAVADHAAHTHSVTSNVGGTVTPAGTVAWPAGVPTHTGIAIADHASHTHSYTDVPNHTHPLNVQGGTTAIVTGTHVMTSAAVGGSARAVTAGDAVGTNTGGVASGTTAGPSAALSHTVSSQGTVAWPAGVPTFAGTANQAVTMTNPAVTSGNPSAVLSHVVTQPSDHTMSGSVASVSAGTPAGTVSQPTYAGASQSVVQPYLVVRFWKRVA